MDFVTSDVCIGIELVAEDSIKKWRGLLGPTNSNTARSEAPESIRGTYGTDGTKNAAHGSDSKSSAKKELDFFFGEGTPMKTTALLNNCTTCIIKPHAIREGVHGKLIDMILDAGFEVSAIEMFNMDKPSAEEFFEVYKGVLPEFVPLVDHMTTGPSLVLEIR